MSLDIEPFFDIDTGSNIKKKCIVYSGNITHNLIRMANSCGLYAPMWRPHTVAGAADEEEHSTTVYARDVIPHLKKAYSP